MKATTVMRRLWTITWQITLFLVLWAILLTPTMLVLGGEAGRDGAPLSPRTRLALELLGVVSVMLAAGLMVRLIDRRPLASLGFTRDPFVRDSVIGLGLGAAMIAAAVVILWMAGWVTAGSLDTFTWSALGVLVAALLFNSITQEVLVRGYILQTIAAQFGPVAAVLASSIIFVVLHAGAIAEGGTLPAINLFGAGLLLALAYTTTGNLWLPIALHFSWNFLQGPVLGVAVSGQALDGGWQLLHLDGPALFTGGRFGLEGGLVATLVTASAIVAVVVVRRQTGEPIQTPTTPRTEALP
jgi:membrane protease YdiL (CAAX protease family)